MFLQNNHCLIWKSEGVSFNQAFKESKDNFRTVGNYITEGNVNSHFKYEFIPNKIQSHLTNCIVYDLETHNTDRVRPYNRTFYGLNNLAGRYNRDLTPHEIDKCEKDTLVFDGDNCVSNASDILLKFNERKVNNKIVEYNLQLHALNGSGFDTWIMLNNLPCDKHIVDLIKKGRVLFL